MPSLRENNKWLTDAIQEADAFARVFKSKAHLPEEVVDTHFVGCAANDSMIFLSFFCRVALKLSKKLDESKATGGDMILATILKCVCDRLAVPFTIVIRRLFHAGCWSSVWKYHLICPIFKGGSASKPGGCRGIRLTTILSKVAEDLVGAHLVSFLQQIDLGLKIYGRSHHVQAQKMWCLC